jgi:hypothetical protein
MLASTRNPERRNFYEVVAMPVCRDRLKKPPRVSQDQNALLENLFRKVRGHPQSSRTMAHRTTVGHVHLSARWVRIALSPSSPLRFRTAGFPQYGSKAGFSDEAFPTMHGHRTAQFAPAVRARRGRRVPSLKVEALDSIKHRHSSGSAALPQGPSLRSGLFCPGPPDGTVK